MGFFLIEYLRGKIEDGMQGQKERDAAWEQRLRGVQKAAQQVKTNMDHPTKNWGFWRNEKHTGKYETNLDPSIAKMPGRAKLSY